MRIAPVRRSSPKPHDAGAGLLLQDSPVSGEAAFLPPSQTLQVLVKRQRRGEEDGGSRADKGGAAANVRQGTALGTLWQQLRKGGKVKVVAGEEQCFSNFGLAVLRQEERDAWQWASSLDWALDRALAPLGRVCRFSLPSARALSLPLSNPLAVLSRSLCLPSCACVGYPVHACVSSVACGCVGVRVCTEEPISTDISKLKKETDFSSVCVDVGVWQGCTLLCRVGS